MKKLATGVMIALLVGGSAAAENLSFSFGTNFVRPNDGRFQASQGTSFLLSWAAEGWTFGVLNENNNLAGNTAAGALVAGTLAVSGIRLSREVVKMVSVGLGIGAAAVTLPVPAATTINRPAVDVVGTVNILSGKGDKVSGSLDAVVSARFINLQGTGAALVAGQLVSNLDGVNLGLAVTAGF